MNDPNALWRDAQGRWRLLYQHRDDAPHWRRTHWGELASDDLLHWREAPIALPADDGTDRFSGCVVRHGAGLRAYSTAHRREGVRHERILLHESAAGAAAEGGPRFGDGRPVIDEGLADCRDPFVFHARGRWWLLLAEPCPWDAAAPLAGQASRLRCYASDDGLRWQPAVWQGPDMPAARLMWEVPQMLPLAALGANDEPGWLLLLSELDRGREPLQGAVRWHRVRPVEGGWAVEPGAGTLLDHGPDFYATMLHTPSAGHGPDVREPDAPDAPPPAGEPPLLMAWMSSWAYARRLPLAGFAGGPMTLPRRLRWDGTRLCQHAIATPAAQSLAPLQGLAPGALRPLQAGAPALCLADDATALDLALRFAWRGDAWIELGIGGFDAGCARLFVGGQPGRIELERPALPGTPLDTASGWAGRWRTPFGAAPPAAGAALRLVLDAGCLEVFADEGRVSLTALVPPAGAGGLWLRLHRGEAGFGLDAQPTAAGAA